MRLIDADELIEKFKKWLPKEGSEWLESSIHPLENLSVSAIMEIEEAPTVEAIPFDSGYIKQIRWERDIALSQLEEIGCSLGQDMTYIKEKLKEE